MLSRKPSPIQVGVRRLRERSKGFGVPFTTVIACKRAGDVSDFQVGLRADKASRAVFLGRLMRGRDKSGGFLAGPYEAGGRCTI